MTDCNIYKVQRGDTLSEIGEWFHVPWKKLQRLNGIEDPDVIDINQVLRLSKSGNVCKPYKVKEGDTLSEIGDRFDVDWRSLAYYNRIEDPDVIFEGQTICIPAARTAELAEAE